MFVDKIIVTVILIISGIVASFAVFNGVYPAVQRSSDAISNASDTISDRIKSDIEIIQVNENASTVNAWIKNIGSSQIFAIENSDIFFGPQNNFARIPYGSSESTLPYWNYQLEGTTNTWSTTVTNRIVIHLASSLSPDTYMLKIIIPNGISDETFFGVQ